MDDWTWRVHLTIEIQIYLDDLTLCANLFHSLGLIELKYYYKKYEYFKNFAERFALLRWMQTLRYLNISSYYHY